MKKYLPVFLFLIGIIVVAGVFLATKSKKKNSDKSLTGEVTTLLDLPLGKRPFASLIPKSDGHWLNLKIERIDIPDAGLLDYELLYKLSDGRTQGVPGTIELNGQKRIERDILLGSESSGKFRYDQGVEDGTLTLKFRSSKGKLLVKFSTDFHLQTNTIKLSSVDGKFIYTLNKAFGKVFFVTMDSFGVPEQSQVDVSAGPVGVFASGFGPYPGKVTLGDGAISAWVAQDGKEIQKLTLVDGKTPDVGIFVSTPK